NGAGKTTLIKHLAGVFIPDSGSICIDGQPVFENLSVKSRIAYIP
ncbi:MAG TPA: ABC transporter, partial [Ruminiclostridium sp.]|nr:ABC transporter [Ruminiclostridium sp.]